MLQEFEPGDILIFQLESGYALCRVLEVDENEGDAVWHVAAYGDLFLDPESADAAIDSGALSVALPHVALTNRAFESTQVARMANVALTGEEKQRIESWKQDPQKEVSDRSIRLMLGLR